MSVSIASFDSHTLEAGAKAIACARPHDLDIERGVPDGSGLPATIKRIAIGPNARIELEADADARAIEVEISRSRLKQLALKEGEQVLIRAKNVRVFPHAQPGT